MGRVLAERVAAATLAKMIRQKETFLLALCTHIATHGVEDNAARGGGVEHAVDDDAMKVQVRPAG